MWIKREDLLAGRLVTNVYWWPKDMVEKVVKGLENELKMKGRRPVVFDDFVIEDTYNIKFYEKVEGHTDVILITEKKLKTSPEIVDFYINIYET